MGEYTRPGLRDQQSGQNKQKEFPGLHAALHPPMHTDSCAPLPEASIRFGVRTECLAILNLVGKK